MKTTGRRLFPPLDVNEIAKSEIRRREREQRVERVWVAEEREMQMFPEMHKVFWSRPADIDKVSHYVLLVNGRKYELRDVSSKHDRSAIQYRTSEVQYDIPSRHAAWLRELGGQSRGGLYDLLLIGWTSLSHEQIDKICSEAGMTWKYRLYWRGWNAGNCQHFVRVVADQVIPRRYQASNWGWFRYDRMGVIQLAQEENMRVNELLEQEQQGMGLDTFALQHF
jgi:hypothetical protein